MNFKAIASAVAVLCTLAAAPAQAALVTFEDVAVSAGTLTTDTDIVSGGFRFDSGSNHSHRSRDYFGGVANGSTIFTVDGFNGTNVLTLTQVGGGAFNLGSLQMAEHVIPSNGNASVVRLVGTLLGGGTVSTNLALDGIYDGAGGVADFQTFAINFANVTSISFSAISGSGDRGFSLDNLNTSLTNAVPEPTSLLLVGLGLVACGLARRRKTAA